MTPIEKVRDAILEAAAYCPEHHGPTCHKIKEALSLLEGKVLVPRKPTPAMKNAAFQSAQRTMPHAKAKAVAWDACVAWDAMIQAAEEGE